MEKPIDSTAKEKRSALFVATLTSFMGPFMISSVNVALPSIQKDLGMDAVQLSWVATSYLLAVAVGLLPAGKIGDLRGRRRMFTAGVLVYTLTAIGMGFVQSGTFLIILRILQGLGAAMFVSTGMAILTTIFPPQERGKVIGIYVSAVYVGLSAGPFGGGFMTYYLGWRSIFFLMLPLGLLCFLLTVRYLPGEWRKGITEKLDYFGCLLYGLAITSLVYGASRLPSVMGGILVGAGLVCLVSFLWQQKISKSPLMEVDLFLGNRIFAYSSYASYLKYSATFGVTFLMSLYLQYIKNMDPKMAGTILMVQPVMMALVSPVAGRMSDRIEPRYLATTGMGISLVCIFLLSRLEPDTPMILIILNLLCLGLGFALFSSPNMSAIMGAVEKRHFGQASGIVATMRLLGQMSSMAIATVVLALLVGRVAISVDNLDRFLVAIQTMFTISTFLCLSGIYFSWFRGKMTTAKEKSAPS